MIDSFRIKAECLEIEITDCGKALRTARRAFGASDSILNLALIGISGEKRVS